MKIILSSNGKFLIEQGYKALSIPTDQIRIGYITTASKGSENLDFIKRHKEEMIKAGYSFEEIDIETKSETEILDFFTNKNIIHVEGGNTFYLLKVIKEIGFDKTLKKLFDMGLDYVGSSAGAYIMCPNIEVSKWGRNADRDFGLKDLTALNYVPFCLKVHYTDEMEADVKEKMTKLEHPLRILRDGQAILVSGNEYIFLGDGEEVILK
jgi:dipeptidase E